MIPASYLTNSVLYIVMVFVTGLMWDRHLAVMLSIAMAALALACADQLLMQRVLTGRCLAAASWAMGVAAAAALVWM